MSSPGVRILCARDKRLAKVIARVGPIAYSCPDSAAAYGFLVHAIIEQMLSITAGQRIFARLEALCGGAVSPRRVAKLSLEELRGVGTSRNKAAAILSLTEAVLAGTLDFAALEDMPDQEVMTRLTALRGIGSWTAKMYLLFVLDRQDVLPFEDGAFLQSYRWLYKTADCSAAAVKQRCAKWSPYSSIAARFMYRALDMGFTKDEFHLRS